jgi:hypothetical protein
MWELAILWLLCMCAFGRTMLMLCHDRYLTGSSRAQELQDGKNQGTTMRSWVLQFEMWEVEMTQEKRNALSVMPRKCLT